MNRKQAAAFLLYRRHNNNQMYSINQSHQQFGEFKTLYKVLRKYLDRFYTDYRMSTEQFDYILSQIEHLIYKPNTNNISLPLHCYYSYQLTGKSVKWKVKQKGVYLVQQSQ